LHTGVLWHWEASDSERVAENEPSRKRPTAEDATGRWVFCFWALEETSPQFRTDFGHLSSRSPHKKTAGVAVNAAQANPVHAQRERPDAEESAQSPIKGTRLNREFLILISIY